MIIVKPRVPKKSFWLPAGRVDRLRRSEFKANTVINPKPIPRNRLPT